MKKGKPFKEVPAQFDFIANERELLDWWYKSGLVEKYLNKNKNSKKKFSFLDGPITANNPMAVHHAWGRALKDLYQRYRNMQGYKQRFQNGFDCQGLWVEVNVEKQKGFKTKKDIENYGIDKFVEECKTTVRKYAAIQTEQSKRLGYFMDWDHSYYTMSDENNYMIWAFLKRCWQEKNLYKGCDSVPWCPRCGTAISQHEIDTEGYKQLTHESVYMRFPVIKGGKPKKDEFLLVWTTTPWTIPADTIIAINPEIEYALVESEGKKYWLAKNLVSRVFGQDLKPLKVLNGKNLLEKEKVNYYQAAFDDLPIIKKVAQNEHFHEIVLAKELVSESEGTGLVHIVPGAGTEDHRLIKAELNWPELIFPVVGEDGSYLDGYGELTGQNAKDHPEIVIDYLKNKEEGRYLLKTEPYTHAYPVCWRCSTELIWRIVDEWYIAMDNSRQKDKKTFRQRMVETAKTVKQWVPKFGLARELDWLKNMHDWLISKKRYWGLALPIWECQCGHFEVIGSKEELKEKAVEGWSEFEGHSPHRPWVDKIKIKCPQCGQLTSRIPDVGNPWLDAGIVSFSTLVDPETGKLSYLDDKKYFDKWYPADLILECFPGQFRNWFYSLIAMSTVLEDRAPFQTLVGHALVRDEKGKEMHKSKGNAIWFDDAAEKMGVDTMRWMFCRQNPELNLNFGYHIADEVRRQHLLLLWNTYKFFITYANLNCWKPQKKQLTGQAINRSVLDHWILSRLEKTKRSVTEKLEGYLHQEALWEIERFIEDLSSWYIRRSRERVNPNNNEDDRSACLTTLFHVLKDLSLILSPFIPYLSETMWQNLSGNKEFVIDGSVHLQNWPTYKKGLIREDLEQEIALVRTIVMLGHSQRKAANVSLRQPLKKLLITGCELQINDDLADLIKQELNVKKIKADQGDKKELKVQLDTKLTSELRTEGETRKLIRNIQILRKEMGLNLNDKIKVFAPSWPETGEKEILTKTGAIKIEKKPSLEITKA